MPVNGERPGHAHTPARWRGKCLVCGATAPWGRWNHRPGEDEATAKAFAWWTDRVQATILSSVLKGTGVDVIYEFQMLLDEGLAEEAERE